MRIRFFCVQHEQRLPYGKKDALGWGNGGNQLSPKVPDALPSALTNCCLGIGSRKASLPPLKRDQLSAMNLASISTLTGLDALENGRVREGYLGRARRSRAWPEPLAWLAKQHSIWGNYPETMPPILGASNTSYQAGTERGGSARIGFD